MNIEFETIYGFDREIKHIAEREVQSLIKEGMNRNQ